MVSTATPVLVIANLESESETKKDHAFKSSFNAWHNSGSLMPAKYIILYSEVVFLLDIRPVAPPTVPVVDCAWQGRPLPSCPLGRPKPDRIPHGFAAESSAGDHHSLTFRPLTQNVSWWQGSEQGRLPDTPCNKT